MCRNREGYLCLSNLCQIFAVYKPSDIARYGLYFNKQEVLTAWRDHKTLCLSVSFCDPEHFVMQINVNHQRLCVWGVLSVLFCHKRYAHPLCELCSRLWFMSRLHLSFFCYFGKGTLDLIWHVGCPGPISLTVRRVHSQCPH